MLKMCCYICFSRNLTEIYRTVILTKFFPIYATQNPVECTHLVVFFCLLMLVISKGHTYLLNLEVLVESLHVLMNFCTYVLMESIHGKYS